MKSPQVSVIIPNYNHAAYLKERIDSILEQSYQDFELIILDDCSTDNSRDIINRYRSNPHVSNIVFDTQNSGNPFSQWGKGFELAQGSMIWIAESDDVAHPEFLATLVSQLNKHPQAALAFSHSYLIDEEGKDLRIEKHLNNNPNTIYVHDGCKFAHHEMLARNDIYNASMVVFRRDVLSHIGNRYQQFHTCGDWFFWVNLCLHGEVIEICRQLNGYRQHMKKVTTLASQSGNDWKEVGGVLNEFVDLLNLNGLSLRLFRGHWTKDLQESRYPDKTHLLQLYPKVFGASRWDVFLYRLSKIPQKILKIKRF